MKTANRYNKQARTTSNNLWCGLQTKVLLADSRAAGNSTYPKGGVSCSKDSFVVNQTLVFQIKFCGKSPALRVAAKRYY
jgi:hypothetical protein